VTRKAKQQSRERVAHELAQRRGGRHCPLCLAALPRIASSGGSARRCAICGAQPSPGVHCARCDLATVWEGRTGAACGSCGHHGSKVAVIAGHEWISRDRDEK
jgi:hypothetical protein